ncbi:MAG: DUF6471 domain-containing protein [Candidatus Gastranaerophilales bacterium]|nr:DUF6471 domain-containing protein [Candidatus Gastranaerophilales bacterium]MCM1338875.1 DUF6471 domain-containing protein [Muribaculaceae bacterium]
MSNPETPKYVASEERKEQARRLVKDFLQEQNTSVYRLARMLNETYGRSASDSNLLNKLTRSSFKVTELMDIAELFDCELKIVPKKLIEGYKNSFDKS